MGYVLVFALAAAVGVAVYLITARGGLGMLGSNGLGRGAVNEPGAAVVGGSRADWQTRMTGLVGLAIAVILASVVLAAAVYAVGSAVGRAIDHAATDGGP
jgi:hypothetical protein